MRSRIRIWGGLGDKTTIGQLYMKVYIFIIFVVVFLSSCVSTTTPIQNTVLTSTPTQQNIPTQTITPIVEYSERIEFSMLSPDGTNEIQTKDWLTFDVINVEDKRVIWSFSYDRAKFGEGDKFLYEAGYSPFYWSQDGKYIYVFARQGWDGGIKYFGDVFGAEEGVARFDVDTGIMTDVIPERYGGGYTFAISPDENGIVYVDQRESPLILRWKSLSSGEEKNLLTFDENIFDVGQFGWSSNMGRLIYMTLEVLNPLEVTQEFSFSFFVIDLENPQPQMILQEFDRWLSFEVWDDENQVFYTDWEDTVWQLDLEKNIITARGTATPGP